jgi:hypothetical protein
VSGSATSPVLELPLRPLVTGWLPVEARSKATNELFTASTRSTTDSRGPHAHPVQASSRLRADWSSSPFPTLDRGEFRSGRYQVLSASQRLQQTSLVSKFASPTAGIVGMSEAESARTQLFGWAVLTSSSICPEVIICHGRPET